MNYLGVVVLLRTFVAHDASLRSKVHPKIVCRSFVSDSFTMGKIIPTATQIALRSLLFCALTACFETKKSRTSREHPRKIAEKPNGQGPHGRVETVEIRPEVSFSKNLLDKLVLSEASISLTEKPKDGLDVEVVVNAANPSLQGGGGIDGAIHAAAGSKLAKACTAERIRRQCPQEGLPCGEALATESFGRLKEAGIRYVVHAVGPDARGAGCSEEALRRGVWNAYCNSMKEMNALMDQRSDPPRSIGFPMISVGIYAVDPEIAGPAAVNAILHGLTLFPKIEKVVLFGGLDQDAQNKGRFAAFQKAYAEARKQSEQQGGSFRWRGRGTATTSSSRSK